MIAAINRLQEVQAEVATTDSDGAFGRLNHSDASKLVSPVHLFRRDFSERWKFSIAMWRWLRRNARKYDVLHIHALWTFSTAAACGAARQAGVPVVIRPCGMLSSYTMGRSAVFKRIYWSFLERRNLHFARRIHVTSTEEGKEATRLGIPEDRIVVIPHGVETHASQTETSPHRLRELCGGQAGNLPIILFLSRLHPKKGVVDILLPAFSRLRSRAFLAIAGGADEHSPEYCEQVRETVVRLGLADRVALLGSIPSSERWSLFDGAAMFILPSHSENFGIVVTEAMSRGTPVIVSDRVHSCEHVSLANAGKVVPLDINETTRALEELLTDPPMSKEMGKRGQEYVQKNLGWDQVAQRIFSMYKDCLA